MQHYGTDPSNRYGNSGLYSLTCTHLRNFPELFRYPRHEFPSHFRPCRGVILLLFCDRPSPQYGTLQEGYPVILQIMLPTKMLAEVGELEVVLLTSTCIHESVLRLQNRALAREACPCMNCHMAVNQNCVWNVPWCSRRMERDDM